MHSIPTPPRTIMEVFKLLPEGTLAEVIEGNLYMLPMPNTNHQRVLLDIVVCLNSFIHDQLGELFIGPFDVYLDEDRNVVQPNIIYVASMNNSIIKPDAIHGVPDLIVEILSPNNEKYDLIKKKELYEKFRVKEYWVINPDSKDSIGFFLKDGRYDAPQSMQGSIKSTLLNHEFSF